MKNTIIFDLDGTLLDTLEDLTASTNHALASNGYPVHTLDEIRSYVGNGIRLLISRALPGGTDNPDFDKVFADFRAHYLVHCNDKTCLYEGIDCLLQRLRDAGYRMAIVSNKADAAVKELHAIYFHDYLDVSLALGEAEAAGIKKKPAPDMPLAALRMLGSAPSDAIYVGDSEVDIETARNSGMDCVSCAWGFRSESFLRACGAQVIIHSPLELLDQLG